MKVSWTKGLDEQQVKDIRGDFKSSLLIRKRLVTLLEEKIQEADRANLAKVEYEKANWAYKQADLVGFKRALTEVISLITDEEK